MPLGRLGGGGGYMTWLLLATEPSKVVAYPCHYIQNYNLEHWAAEAGWSEWSKGQAGAKAIMHYSSVIRTFFTMLWIHLVIHQFNDVECMTLTVSVWP